MLFSTINETACGGLQTPVALRSNAARTKRIAAVLGLSENGLPRVDECTLAPYYRYLSANLSWPFTAHYPLPTTPEERAEFRCTALELLDPVKDIYDDFDGIFCKTRKGKYEINLPLSELVVPDESPNGQLIEDYWYWFTNWR
jgi:hypothetical protein